MWAAQSPNLDVLDTLRGKKTINPINLLVKIFHGHSFDHIGCQDMWPHAVYQRIASTLGLQLMTALNTRTLSRVNVVSPPGVCSEHLVLRVALFEFGFFPIAPRFRPFASLAKIRLLSSPSLHRAPPWLFHRQCYMRRSPWIPKFTR